MRGIGGLLLPGVRRLAPKDRIVSVRTIAGSEMVDARGENVWSLEDSVGVSWDRMTVPLHTRMISLRLRWSRPGEVLAEGRLLDLRKRAIVPLGASLRGPGVVHDMKTRVWIDTETMSISRVDPEMLSFPYVASEHTAGESCPGRIADVQNVVGTRLNESYGDQVNGQVGGPRGCFHIFTLLRMTGPAVQAGLASEHVIGRMAAEIPPKPDEVLWNRTVTIDSHKGEGLGLHLHGTLTDVFQSGGPPEDGSGTEELIGGIEVMADFSTAFPDMGLNDVSGRRRKLSAGIGNVGTWADIDNFVRLQGVNVRKGFSAQVQKILGDEAGLRPESHLVFMMAPVVMQSMPGLLEEMQLRASAGTGAGGGKRMGTALNSCHMWRADGPLNRVVSGTVADSDQSTTNAEPLKDR